MANSAKSHEWRVLRAQNAQMALLDTNSHRSKQIERQSSQTSQADDEQKDKTTQTQSNNTQLGLVSLKRQLVANTCLVSNDWKANTNIKVKVRTFLAK